MVTPAEQGRGYAVGLPLSRQPRYVITCNFSTIRVYDRNTDPLCAHAPQPQIELADLPKNVAAIQFLKGSGEAPASVARAVSVEAGRIMGEIHDRIAPLYHDPDSEESHHALSVLCARLMFLMFSEDAGLIEPGLFQRYIAANDAAHLRRALIDLFAWLDTGNGARADEYPDELLARFPYMDGGLFRERIPIPQLDETVRTEILVSGCQEFDWSGVDPTVFGSIFEGALSHDARRAGGMHYTSPENIHKVIDPLFLDGLKEELDGILASRTRAPAPARSTRSTRDWVALPSSTPHAARATSSPRRTFASADWRIVCSWSSKGTARRRPAPAAHPRPAPTRPCHRPHHPCKALPFQLGGQRDSPHPNVLVRVRACHKAGYFR